MKTGIVILGHGSRSTVDEANQVLLNLAATVKERTGAELLETAFMNPKSQRQNLAGAVDKLVANGAKKIIVAPVFLSNGLHMQRDIPEEIAQLKEKYRIEIKHAAHLGADPRIVDVLVDRIREVGES